MFYCNFNSFKTPKIICVSDKLVTKKNKWHILKKGYPLKHLLDHSQIRFSDRYNHYPIVCDDHSVNVDFLHPMISFINKGSKTSAIEGLCTHLQPNSSSSLDLTFHQCQVHRIDSSKAIPLDTMTPLSPLTSIVLTFTILPYCTSYLHTMYTYLRPPHTHLAKILIKLFKIFFSHY